MSWLHRVLGKNGTTQLAVDPTQFAERVSGRPMELGARGSYVLNVQSGLMAAGLGAAAEIYQARWVDTTRVCLLRSITFNAARDTTAFATGTVIVRATIARGWSADGGSGTPVVFSTANTNKRRTDFPLSLYSDTGVRISATAALTAGTKTFDTNDFGGAMSFISTGATSVPDPYIIAPGTYLWQRNTHDEYPILFEQNEGFAIRITVPATGTWRFNVGVEWAELDPALVDGW